MKQLYADLPKLNAVVTAEQSYGFEVLKNWMAKWRGENIDPGTCWGEGPSKANIRPTYVNFVRYAPANFAKIKDLFQKADVPANFMFTTLIESPSFFRKKSEIQVSKSMAVGPWQIMESVANDWGLTIFPVENGVVDPRDERADFVKASNAAISQYDRLLDYFGESDYKLALAAYNQGAQSLLSSFLNSIDVQKYDRFFKANFGNDKDMTKPENYQERINKNKTDLPVDKSKIRLSNIDSQWKEKIPSYWFLHEFHMMSCETRDYVPKLVSAMIIGENPKAFGF
jgi:hypothetical protein